MLNRIVEKRQTLPQQTAVLVSSTFCCILCDTSCVTRPRRLASRINRWETTHMDGMIHCCCCCHAILVKIFWFPSITVYEYYVRLVLSVVCCPISHLCVRARPAPIVVPVMDLGGAPVNRTFPVDVALPSPLHPLEKTRRTYVSNKQTRYCGRKILSRTAAAGRQAGKTTNTELLKTLLRLGLV